MNIVLMDRVESVSFTTNFVGKIAGSVVVNPNISKRNSTTTSLQAPNGTWTELTDSGTFRYNRLDAIDASLVVETSALTVGLIAQNIFSFDLISLTERKHGTIPAGDIAGKVVWLKANVTSVTGNWWGYGSSPLGNKATYAWWGGSSWASPTNHSNGTVSALSRNIAGSLSTAIDANGFVHFIAYADASDGVTASIINTDYVELVVNLNIRQ